VKNKHTRRRERKIVKLEDDRHRHYRFRSHSRSRGTIHSPPGSTNHPRSRKSPDQPNSARTRPSLLQKGPIPVTRKNAQKKETAKRKPAANPNPAKETKKKDKESVETIQPCTTSKDLAGGGAPRMEATYKPERRATPPIDLVIWKKEPEGGAKVKSSKPRQKKQNPPKAPSTTRSQPKQNQQAPQAPSITQQQDEIMQLLELEVSEFDFDELA